VSSASRVPITSPSLRVLLEAKKKPSRLLGDVRELLLKKQGSDDRPTDVLHPSEVAHNEWCPRATYYRLAGRHPNETIPPPHWRMAMIWDEGKEIHRKWQGRFWDLGRLKGDFYCFKCQYAWEAQSPENCERCGADRDFLVFHEVPLYNDALRMAGHADGLDGDEALIEIKSVGLGTLRFENPDLLATHTYKLNLNGRQREFIDYDGLWSAIQNPFPAHIRQGHLYSFLGAPETEIFIYECKWNQADKEFVIKYKEDRIADRLESCRRIVRALNGDSIPLCPHGGCGDCKRYEEKSDDGTGRKQRLHRRPTKASSGAAPADRGGLPPGVPGVPGPSPKKRLYRDRH
jgi:hypothetical protein